MDTEEERKARLEKKVATTELKLALYTDEEKRGKKKEWIYGNLDLIWIDIGVFSPKSSRNELAAL